MVLRLFASKPWSALVIIAVLSLGTGAVLSLFSLVDAVFLRPLPYPQADRLVWLRERDEDVPSKISYPNFLDWQRRSTAFDSLAAVKEIQATLTKDGHAIAVDAGLVTADYFRVIGVAPTAALRV
jgi:putative ABC transport system permease protein